jgi:glycosyltransferase involved in cell wall biosynthesis
MTRGALVHEWIAPFGGSENVFEQIALAFPEADLHCLWNDAPHRFETRPVAQTWLGRTPLRRHKAAALPFMTAAWRGLKGGPYDWALISSHAFAHHASFEATSDGFKKFVYVHTPARYIWTPELDERGSGLAVRLAAGPLRGLDRKRAQEASALIANSHFVRERIRRAWDRDSDVIYPPVDIESIQKVTAWRDELSPQELAVLESLPEDFVLGASRFIPYKRLDQVIEAAEIAGRPAVIAGAGPLESALRRQAETASVPVTFVIAPSNALLFAIYQRASVFVFVAIEDFGIMPIESIACGTPVIVGPIGGAVEGVQACEGGAVVHEFSRAGWQTAFDEVERIDRASIRSRAGMFSRERFRQAISTWVHDRI